MNPLRNIFHISLFAFLPSLIFSSAGIQGSPGGTNVEKKICYVGNIFTETGKRFVTIDIIEWSEGEKAVQIYKKDHPKSTEPLSNGYYIHNTVITWDTLAIADTAQFVMQTYSHDVDGNFRRNERIDFDRIAQLFSQSKRGQYGHIPFWIVISKGFVISITEQYIP